MKTPFIPLMLAAVLVALVPIRIQAQPRTPIQTPATAAYVSDTLEIPLRAGASDRYKVIGSARTGSPVEVLKANTVKGYTQIRTPAGVKGWLPSQQLTDTPSSQEQLAGARRKLEQLQARHGELQQHMNEVLGRPDAEAVSYPQLYEEALQLRQQLAYYRKVAVDTVAIDEHNKVLQERVVTLERELQIVEQENRSLRNDNNNIRFLMGAVLLGTCLAMAVLMPRVREQRRAQWSRL